MTIASARPSRASLLRASLLRSSLAALGLLALGADIAAAQADPGACIRLEGQLAQLDRGGGGQRDLGGVIAQQQQDVANLSAQVRQLGCDKRGFLIFQPQLPPQCDGLNRRLSQARSALDRTMIEARGQRSGNDEQRRQLIYALAQNNCGPQYQAALGQARGNAPAAERRPRNFFEQLFGVPRQAEEDEAPSMDAQPLEMELPKASTYRTVCVRTCDGFFFPISYAANAGKFASDEALCQRQCPGTEARLFVYRNPGEDIENAVSVSGQTYMSLPNALLYKKQYSAACSCRPNGQSWAQALSSETDPTLRKGDIVVTEDASREMSQPRPAGQLAAPATPRPRTQQPQQPATVPAQ
ncbi:DUF2865 domain-containing protein [Ancylobacter oerskovii]|uniref:DUF2865 domain-containing protein n=1 Tax=Ancylobacter oerskovii TaxID=459519 RepID=A0ABW4Z0R7_9HYPH|nr:DUF2865 domain-containing protein [Ancylobacter oerskovii]MBS7541555.1 DUF2865 domain-containing protein [Ancylobacter oerskovii]